MTTRTHTAAALAAFILLSSTMACSADPEPEKSPESTEAAAETPAPTEDAEPVVEGEALQASDVLDASIQEMVEAWEPTLLGGDLASVTMITVRLPKAVTEECASNLEDFQLQLLEEYEDEANAGLEQATAENGGARGIDFLQHWGGYVRLAGELCG